MNQSKRVSWALGPPWIIICAFVGTVIVAGIMFTRDYRRERDHLQNMFVQKGEVLIHSLEIIGRVAPGETWNSEHLITFWNGLEESDNVLFLAITDEEGRPQFIVGDLEPEAEFFKDPIFFVKPAKAIVPEFRINEVNGQGVLTVYRLFWPRPEPSANRRYKKQHSMSNGHSRGGSNHDSYANNESRQRTPPPRNYLWVGFDMRPFADITRARVRTAAIFVGLCSLAALAGVLAMFWSSKSRLTRKLYQETNALAAELIGRLPLGFILQDAQSKVTLINQSTQNISGLNESQWLGRTIQELTGGHFPQDDQIAGLETDIAFTGGQSVRVSLNSGPVMSHDNRILGRVVLMEDLGELGHLKAELAGKERLAALGSLAAGLAHEIRNPLGAIRGLSQHLLNKKAGDAQDREALEVMLTSVDRLNDTITNFLEYSRPEVIKKESIDLAGLVRKMATLVSHDAQSCSVTIALELPDDPIMISGDESGLSRAFLNLYLNAIQAAGGRPDGRLLVSLNRQEKKLELIFKDNGPGFTTGQLASSFVPYFTTKAEGTGLGLAMVEKTIKAHGAAIYLANQLEGGGQVTIIFPDDEPSQAANETVY